jgi:hypothetical protein
MAEAFRLEVDFNYSGGDEDKGVVYLHPKEGDRTGLYAPIQRRFDAAGVQPRDGLPLILYEPRADRNDEDVVCDMEVPGVLKWIEEHHYWIATFDPHEIRWIPSAPM